MKNIVETLKSKPLLLTSTSASDKEISDAETKLSVSFSEEYKQYLATVGFAIFEGHELTGICKAKRLNVVDVTSMERELSPYVPFDWYVIEQLNIDGIVIWQSSAGEVYQTSPNVEPVKLCNSMAEYINL